MAREVNVYLGDWTSVGTNASVPRWSIQIQSNWVDNAGEPHTNTRTVTFPNVLTGIPAERLKQYMMDIVLAEARILAGADN